MATIVSMNQIHDRVVMACTTYFSSFSLFRVRLLEEEDIDTGGRRRHTEITSTVVAVPVLAQRPTSTCISLVPTRKSDISFSSQALGGIGPSHVLRSLKMGTEISLALSISTVVGKLLLYFSFRTLTPV